MPQIQGVKGEAVVRLPRTLDNAGDTVSSALPKGKQQGEYYMFAELHNMWDYPKDFVTYETPY